MTKNDLTSRVLLIKEFKRGENSPFETVEPHKKIQPQLVDNQKLETSGTHKRRVRSNVFKVGEEDSLNQIISIKYKEEENVQKAILGMKA